MAGGWHAEDLAELDLSTAVSIHCSSRCYPPIPQKMVPTLVEAIEASSEGDWYRRIDLPEGVEYRGCRWATAQQIVEGHRLHDLITGDDYENLLD